MTQDFDIGALRHRVAFIDALPASFDEAGGRDAQVTRRIDTWAAIEVGAPASIETQDQRETGEQLSVTIRYRTDISRDDHMIWRGVPYRIDSLTPMGTQCRFMRLACQADL